MQKKAQGISINTIIIAVIALTVLIILIAVFTGRISLWGRGIDDIAKGEGNTCPGGNWKAICNPDDEQALYGIFSDAKDNPGMTCCVSRPE
ncbi:MAG: hypothetical protein KAK00_09115 [Nanoarchaeota archaeon]|nr:hypothetical protein [Nanoarchaeota archaeon]